MKNFLIILIGLVGVFGFKSVEIPLDFALQNMQNKTISLSDYKSQKGVIVIFVTNNCPVSEKYVDRIVALQKKYGAKGFPVVAIDPIDNFEAMIKVYNNRKYPYEFLYDKDQTVVKNYKVNTNMHSFILVSKNGVFEKIYEGALDDDFYGDNVQEKFVENAISEYMQNKPVSKPLTKVIGCPISYRKAKKV
jgi:peroxiredoxin